MKSTDLAFNPAPSHLLHVDLNSCFASIEQQADPLLRGKPVAVAAYATDRGCIIAPSIEAKRLGIKVGMRVKEGRLLCRELVVLQSDPEKYQFVHRQMRKLLEEYTDRLTPLSIDEFVLDLEGISTGHGGLRGSAHEIKTRIREEVGDWLTVSVGIAPNRFLAKLAAGLYKPDGLDEICVTNYREIYARLRLMDLHGIKQRNCIRLNQRGIYSVMDFYHASAQELQAAFESINGFHWYRRLRGWEPDNVEFDRHSYGNSFAVGDSLSKPEELAPILMKLVEKTGFRMRKAGYRCRGVHVAVVYRSGAHWHQGMSVGAPLFDSRDIYKLAFHLLCRSPHREPVQVLAESVYGLERAGNRQLSFLDEYDKKQRLVQALDGINSRWGNYTITPARMVGTEHLVPNRVPFGSVKELEEFVLTSAGHSQ